MLQVDLSTQGVSPSLNGVYTGPKTCTKIAPVWDADNAKQVLQKRYLIKNEKGKCIEDASDLFKRVAKAVAAAEIKFGMHQERAEAVAQNYYDMMAAGRFMPNSPTLMNAGRELGLLSACFVLPIPDSIEGIFDAVKTTALIQRGGGGTGFCLDRLRPTGDHIKTSGGQTSGPISFWKIFCEATRAISQGSFRRGANMMQLLIDACDIVKFIHAKQDLTQFENFNISVKVPDYWMKEYIAAPDSYAIVINKRSGKKYLIPREFKNDPKTPVHERTTIHNYRLEDLIEIDETTLLSKPDAWTKRDLWDVIVTNAHATGEPGVVFIDRIAAANPTPNVGYMEATNPCVAGSTLVAVADGRGCVPIKQLAEEGVDVLVHSVNPTTGETCLRMGRNPRKTGTAHHIYKVTFDDGSFIRTNANHKFLLRTGEEKKCSELVYGDSLMPFNQYQQPNTTTGKLYWYTATRKQGPGSRGQWGQHTAIARHFHGDPGEGFVPHHINGNSLDNRPENLKWLTVSEHNKIEPSIYVQYGENNGMFGKKHSNETKELIGAKTTERLVTPEARLAHGLAVKAGLTEESRAKMRGDRVERIKLTCPVCSKEFTMLPSRFVERTCTNESGQIFCSKACSNARVMSKEELIVMGTECIEKCNKLTDRSWNVDFKQINPDRPDVKVAKRIFGSFATFKEECYSMYNHSVHAVVADGVEDVYNITVDEFHTLAYVTNADDYTKLHNNKKRSGIYTFNCGEQPLLPFEACNLGSLNLGAFVIPAQGIETATHQVINGHVVDWDQLAADIHLSTRFLENVVEINKYPTPEVDEICRGNRKIGLGVMGFADALFKLGIPYDSEVGVAWGERFMRFLNDEAHNESERLAVERGCFSNWDGSRWDTDWKRLQRNACSTTVAPTGTISIIANCSGGIEPMFSVAFLRQVMPGHGGKLVKMFEINEVFKKLAHESNYWGYDRDEMYDRISTEGTLHKLDKIPESVRRIFVCAHDIAPEWHVKMQSAFQKHCDSSISKTTNFPHSATKEEVAKIYNLAFELGCKGVTVYRDGCRKNQPMALKETPKVMVIDPLKLAGPIQDLPEFKAALAKALDAYRKDPLNMVIKAIRTPDILSSLRIRQNTPFGHMHINVTVDPVSGKELELFAQLGKGGEIAAADLEAICRVVSLHLRSGGVIESIIEQLDGIGTTTFVATKTGRVASLGDGLAKALRRYMNMKKAYGLEDMLLGKVNLSTDESAADTKASGRVSTDEVFRVKCQTEGCLGHIIKSEGCERCTNCSYSKC